MENSKLMTPLFYDGNFNREGHRMRAVLEKEISDGTQTYRLWRAAGKPDLDYPRADNDKYILEQWGLDTKASACAFCPFHRNFFYQYVQQYEPETYAAIVGVDNLLRGKTPMPPMKSQLFISRSRKRIVDLTPEDCNDAECFEYCGQQVWNGF